MLLNKAELPVSPRAPRIIPFTESLIMAFDRQSSEVAVKTDVIHDSQVEVLFLGERFYWQTSWRCPLLLLLEQTASQAGHLICGCR